MPRAQGSYQHCWRVDQGPGLTDKFQTRRRANSQASFASSPRDDADSDSEELDAESATPPTRPLLHGMGSGNPREGERKKIFNELAPSFAHMDLATSTNLHSIIIPCAGRPCAGASTGGCVWKWPASLVLPLRPLRRPKTDAITIWIGQTSSCRTSQVCFTSPIPNPRRVRRQIL